MNPFFGERWDAPIVDDAPQSATPVGVFCLDCDEEIVAGDQGFLRPLMTTIDSDIDLHCVIQNLGVNGSYRTVLTAIHRECDMLGVIGHLVQVCSCHHFDGTRREMAREAARRWHIRADSLR